MNETSEPRIGFALGSGASRGWSHIGVLEALLQEGIEPDIICGTSVGAMVGGSYVAGNLQALKDWVLSSKRSDVLKFFDMKPTKAGFVDLATFRDFLHSYVAAEDCRIEDLPKRFVAIATDLDTGREVWLREGGLAHAARASMAMPGLFPAVRHQHRWLVDGGLVNPVPVSVCRALGADIVIGVNLNADIVGKWRKKADAVKEQEDTGVLKNIKKQAREYSTSLFAGNEDKETPPGLFYAIPSAINIFQDRITRSRLVGDPADVLVTPRVGDIGILEFQRAEEAMEKGVEAVVNVRDEIRRAMEMGAHA